MTRRITPTTLAVLAVLALMAAGFHPADAGEKWPSLAKQLSKDRVRPQSALARLIAANQDFQLLRDDEAADRIPVPPWLRVIWRKAHPEPKPIPGDPTGGYPLVLREAYEWMMTHQDLQPGRREAARPPAAQQKIATSGGEERLSGLQFEPRSESSISINPWDPSKIIAASNDIGGSGSQAEYYSTNFGVSWGQTALPLASGDAFDSDPTVDWTSDGTAWSVTIGVDSGVTNLELRAYKSIDHGATWNLDTTLSGSQNAADKEMIWVDHANSSAYKDNLYVIWHNNGPVYINRRTAASGNWQTPIQVSGAETTGTGIGGDVKTNSAGVVFGTWPDTGSQAIWTVKSTDGGASYSVPVMIAGTFGSFDIGIPADDNRRALIYVSTGAYKNATRNGVYATWNDLSGAPGCMLSTDEPGSDASSTCKTRIWFAGSNDGGSTWSAPKMINNQAALNDQFFPWLSVDPTSGALGVVYYDTINAAGRLKTDVWYQSSFDGGQSWSSPLKITSAQTDETAASADAGNQYGDYIGLSGYAGRFFPSWTDRRNNVSEEIWTAGIQDPAPLQYYTLVPCRLIDTRRVTGTLGGPALQPQSDRLFALATVCSVPVDAKAVSLNVTVTGGTAAGDVRLYPGGQARPLTSNINYSPGQTRANSAVVALGQDGLGSLAVRCDSAGTVQFILDVNGYFK